MHTDSDRGLFCLNSCGLYTPETGFLSAIYIVKTVREGPNFSADSILKCVYIHDLAVFQCLLNPFNPFFFPSREAIPLNCTLEAGGPNNNNPGSRAVSYKKLLPKVCIRQLQTVQYIKKKNLLAICKISTYAKKLIFFALTTFE